MWHLIADLASGTFLVLIIFAAVYLFRDRAKAKRLGLYALAAFAVVCVAVAVDPPATPVADTVADPVVAAQPEPEPHAIEVSAYSLFAAYEQNEVAADNKYQGKVLRVVGVVGEVSKDFTGDVIVDLRTPNEFTPVRAYVVEAEVGKVANLMRGDGVSLFCEGNGAMLGSPILKGCVLGD